MQESKTKFQELEVLMQQRISSALADACGVGSVGDWYRVLNLSNANIIVTTYRDRSTQFRIEKGTNTVLQVVAKQYLGIDLS